MGKFDGKKLSGRIGKLVFRRVDNQQIVQKAATRVKHTKAAKAAANLFGKASTLAKSIRWDLESLFNDKSDGKMVNRFTTENRAILDHCLNKETGKFVFTEHSFSRLAGFEFNLKSPITNSLWVTPTLSLNGNILKITIPEIEVKNQLKFPAKANSCKLTVGISFIILDQGLSKPALFQSVEISDTQIVIPEQEFTFEAPIGCLCVAATGLNYFNLAGNVKTLLNTKTFNPAAVLDSIITPGTFVHIPFISTPHKSKASEWHSVFLRDTFPA